MEWSNSAAVLSVRIDDAQFPCLQACMHSHSKPFFAAYQCCSTSNFWAKYLSCCLVLIAVIWRCSSSSLQYNICLRSKPRIAAHRDIPAALDTFCLAFVSSEPGTRYNAILFLLELPSAVGVNGSSFPELPELIPSPRPVHRAALRPIRTITSTSQFFQTSGRGRAKSGREKADLLALTAQSFFQNLWSSSGRSAH